MDKTIIIEKIKKRNDINTDFFHLEEIYDDVISDILMLTHRKTLDDSFESLVKEMMEYRMNTQGTIGILNDGYSGVQQSYNQDYPQRILRKIRLRRLYGGV